MPREALRSSVEQHKAKKMILAINNENIVKRVMGGGVIKG